MQFSEMFSVSSEWLLSNAISILAGLVILVVGWILSKIVSRGVARMLPSSRAVDATITPLLTQVVRYAILIVTLVVVLSQFGVETASILAVVGAAGLAIALAMQGTLANIAAGVMLIWLRPFSIEEYVDAEGVAGTVVEIGLFSTRLRTADGVFVMVPNSQLWSSAITNYSREPSRRFDLRIGIAYDADIETARKELLKLAEADERVHADPEPMVYVDGLGDSAVTMMLRIWVDTADFWPVRFDLTEKAKLAFDKAGVEIPYNKLDINVLGELAGGKSD